MYLRDSYSECNEFAEAHLKDFLKFGCNENTKKFRNPHYISFEPSSKLAPESTVWKPVLIKEPKVVGPAIFKGKKDAVFAIRKLLTHKLKNKYAPRVLEYVITTIMNRIEVVKQCTTLHTCNK